MGLNKFLFCGALLFAGFIQASPLFAQNENTTKTPKPTIYKRPITRQSAKEIPLLKELSFGINFSSIGWGAAVERLVRDEEADGLLYKGYYADIAQIYHLRENKTASILKNPNGDNASGNINYVYGKINSFFPITLGYMMRKNISGKLAYNHIQIHVLGGAGLSIGLVKPYYLQIARKDLTGNFVPIDEKYSEANALQFLDKRFIYGYSGFSKGWGDADVNIGAQVKSAIQFEYNPSRNSPLYVEIGGAVNAYLQQVKLMNSTDNKAVFPSIYCSIKKGFRW